MSVWLVAELSCNHTGDKGRACELVYAAKDAGANAIKLQTFTPEDMAPDGPALQGTRWDGHTLRDLYRAAQTPWDWHADLFALAASLGLDYFSSPFSPEAVAFLESIGCPAYKIASMEIGYAPLLDAIEATGKPVYCSTGMAHEVEILHIARRFGQDGRLRSLLHCVSAYPTPIEAAHLTRIGWLAERFKGPVGLSDHSTSVVPPIVATAMGCNVIEKHLMLPGTATLDADHSLTPDAFRLMVGVVRETEAAMAAPQVDVEAESRVFKRTLQGGQWLRG